MKPAPFEYIRCSSLDEAIRALSDLGEEAKLLAGGQSLVPMLNMRLVRPKALVDINGVQSLSYIREEDGWLAIGSLTRQRDIEKSPLVKAAHPLLHEATLHIGHPQIRNRGTIGGSIAHAFPSAEYPAVVVAVDGRIKVVGPSGERTVPARQFFTGIMSTALDVGEVIAEVQVPRLAQDSGWGFVEFTRRHGDFAIAGAIAIVQQDGPVVRNAEVTVFGVGPVPVVCQAASQALIGEQHGDTAVARAAEAVERDLQEVEVISDVHASADYRRHLARVMVKRALLQALERARSARP
ncbi:MAG TPA: xanthine dehydrogenase family protein subunit M [Dehalococcoidia bacterium]|nr:xanthine dehydrogenase family protein subunit M [Dehalococcoidia bacterium]